MHDPSRINIDQAIDACRPQSEDLRQPEFAQLARQLAGDAELRQVVERSQAFDSAVQRILQDVPVPEGLAERLLARLADAATGPRLAGAGDEAAIRPGQAGHDGVPEGRFGRRIVNRLVVSGAVAATLLLAFWLVPRRTHTVEQIVPLALDWVDSRLDPRGWQTLVPEQSELRDFPVPREVIPIPRAWQRVRTELARRCVAYRLGSERRPAYLFLVPAGYDRADLPRTAPRRPQHQTGSWLVAVWQDGQQRRACVLVFPGSALRYEDLVRTSSGLAQSEFPTVPLL
jgi:hypothetical protein